MLNPNNDRLDYGQILAPPAGYDLDFAVGTTYSLDLDALVGASLALGLSREKAARLIRSNGIVIDHITRYTPDTKLSEGSRFSVRGYGKFLFKSVDGVSKKDRIHITVCKFV